MRQSRYRYTIKFCACSGLLRQLGLSSAERAAVGAQIYISTCAERCALPSVGFRTNKRSVLVQVGEHLWIQVYARCSFILAQPSFGGKHTPLSWTN